MRLCHIFQNFIVERLIIVERCQIIDVFVEK